MRRIAAVAVDAVAEEKATANSQKSVNHPELNRDDFNL